MSLSPNHRLRRVGFWPRLALLGVSLLPAQAQLGGVLVEGVRVEARAMHLSGDSRDLDCSLLVSLAGEKVAHGISLSRTRIVQAMDDTGANLVRTNRSALFADLPPSRTWSPPGFVQTLWFKHPATNARAIRILEWETELQSSNADPQTLRLRLENVRLPWFDPPRLQVIVHDVRSESGVGNSSRTRVRLTFAGGPVPGSAGLRGLRIHTVATDEGRRATVAAGSESSSPQFSPLQEFSGSGRILQRDIWLDVPPSTKAIRTLQGEAELFFPAASNGGRVEFAALLGRAGERLEHPSFASNNVQVTFLGVESFETRRRIESTNRIRFVGALPSPPLAEKAADSLLFSITDPEARVGNVSFHARDGEPLPVLTQMIESELQSPRSNRWQLYTFKTAPPPGTSVTILVITPQSLERIPFQVENIPLR
jgi:hypothetical protein